MGESDSSDQGGSFSVADVQCVVSVNGAMDSGYITSPTDQSVAAAMCFPQILYMHSLTKMLACLFRPLFNVYVLQSSSIRGNISAINI